MTWIDRLNARFGRFGVPHATEVLILGQVVAFLVNAAPSEEGAAPLLANIRFAPDKVLAGEWWRVITFLFDPPPMNLLFAFIFWNLFYLMGTTLEANWGAFRYNLYLLLGYVASICMGFAVYFSFGALGEAASNMFVQGTVFLAFARLYPDFIVMLMFILPVKVRWLALGTWIVYGVTLLFSQSWMERGMVFASVFNYLVFFGREILQDAKYGQRRMQFQARSLKGKPGRGKRMEHTCHACGLSSADSPKTAFRYCMECGGEYCYCPEHLANHEHVKTKGAL